MGKKIELNYKELTDSFVYDYTQGRIYWKINKCKARIGSEAGLSLNNAGYRLIKFNYKRISFARIAWTMFHGMAPSGDIDHIDGDPLNNKIENLRDVTKSQNMMNRANQKNNKSGQKGVGWASREKRWRVRVKKEGREYCFGYFKCYDEAVDAYKLAEAELHGQYRRVV